MIRPEGEKALSNVVPIADEIYHFQNGTNHPVPYTNTTYVPIWQTV